MDYAQPSEQMPQMDPMMGESAPEEAAAPEPIILEREQMLGELLAWSKSFVSRSADWRRASYEDDWRTWQRNSDSKYDPILAEKKEPWQSRAFWPLTAAHRENAQAQLFKTEVGPNPPLDVKARPGIVPKDMPGADQSDNIRDLVLREREKSEYELNRNRVIEDKTTYGSGFMQIYFDTVIEDRLVWEDVQEPLLPPDQDGGASLQRSMAGQPAIVGRNRVVRPQVIYRGVRARHISIWDVFPDPQALQVAGSPIAIRYRTTLEQVMEGAKPTAEGHPGWVIPEAVEKLKNEPSDEHTPTDKQAVQTDREIVEGKIERTERGKVLECHEIQARLPKKWVLINGEDIDDPEALIPARVRFHNCTVISVAPSENYDGEPDIYKDDYFPVAGQFYGRGVPEMVKDSQAVANESVNQRLDSGTVALLNVYGVIEKSVVDPKDFTLGPGSVIRFKAKDGMTNIDQLFKKIDMGTLDRGSFIEPQEWERAAQERTSITATTLGSEDNSNTTLGAQKIQQGVTGGKIAYLGMLSEFDFQRKVFYAFYKNIYSNYAPEDYALALGPERAQTVISLTPEQLNNSYQYYPLGVFESENKAQRQAQKAALQEQYGMFPWFNTLGNAKSQISDLGADEATFILPEADAMQIMGKAQEMAQGMAQQMVDAQAPKPGGPPK